jgi:hypothetical protein
MMSEQKKLRGRGRQTLLQDELLTLQAQLKDALLDASMLQRQSRRKDASYISEMKLASNRISAIERLIARKKDAIEKPLKKENEKLKSELAAARLEIETLKQQQQQQRPVEPVAGRPQGVAQVAPQADPAEIETTETTLERIRRMRQGERVPTSFSSDEALAKMRPVTPAPRLPAISGIPEHAFQPVPLTPPRVEPSVERLAQPRPVIPPAETEKKAIATSCSQFNDKRIQANVERIQAEARRNAPKSQVEAIEVEVTDEAVVHEKYREAQERLAKLRALKQ